MCMLAMSAQRMRMCVHNIIIEACCLAFLQIGKNFDLKQKLIVLSSLILGLLFSRLLLLLLLLLCMIVSIKEKP